MSREVVVGGLYRHFRGNTYLVIGTAMHTEVLSTLVLYRALGDTTRVWARPIEIFLEEMKSADGAMVPRFLLIE